MQFIYTLILYLISPLVLLRLFWLARKNPAYSQRWPERFGFLPEIRFSKPVLWIHAVSVGEVHATKPIVKKLLEKHPQYQIIMTTMTPTGALSVRQNYEDDVEHLYLPYDLPFAIKRFLIKFKPALLIVMETELWPNLFSICERENVPVVLINARLSVRSMKGYQCLKPLTKNTLNVLSVIGAQSRMDADRFMTLGASVEKVVVTGNLKFDIRLPHSVLEQAQSLRRQFSIDRPVWIAASTHDGEEELVLEAFDQVLQTYKDCLLIIVPRHPERCESVLDLCDKRDLNAVRRSQFETYDLTTQVFILDTLGELGMFYACADVAFVGGSLLPDIGGHNMLEPASLGIPVITGKYLFNFVEVSELLYAQNALVLVSDLNELAQRVVELLQDANLRHSIGERGKGVITENQGATERVMNIIGKYV